MKHLTSFFVLTWLVGLSFKYAASIKCYECESYGINSACRTSVNSSMIKTCSIEVTLCSISKADMTINGGEAYTKRSCHIKNKKGDRREKKTENIAESDDEYIASAEEPRTSFTLCNSDLCNGAVNNSSTNIILLTMLEILFLSFQKYNSRI